MSKHTPGPWNSMRASAGGREIITSDVSPVDVCVLSHRDKSAAEIEANARLIAAAPELLEALKPFAAVDLRTQGVHHRFADDVLRARAAITKAQGGAA